MVSQNIVILGLSEAATHFLKHMQALQSRGVTILGIYSQDEDSDGVALAKSSNIDIMSLEALVDLGESIDMIFDFTGDRAVRSQLRNLLFSSNNQHTVIAPECIVQLMYTMLGGDEVVGQAETAGY